MSEKKIKVYVSKQKKARQEAKARKAAEQEAIDCLRETNYELYQVYVTNKSIAKIGLCAAIITGSCTLAAGIISGVCVKQASKNNLSASQNTLKASENGVIEVSHF